ncbi:MULTISPECIES: FecR family protein [unclassified Polaribacter]|uniref:FecR family protein n=1 Tax=unclassified Polaribacter TaxID=196858 RepID=UPI001CB9211C|nr:MULTISPECIES: FecR family protein [unclassified Polaribacter]
MRLKKTEAFKTLEKIAHYAPQIATPKVDVQKALASLKLKTKKTAKKNKVVSLNFKQIFKYAAALLVLFTSGYFLLFNNTSSFKTTYAQTKNVTLPDNSEVFLNANSEIIYTKKNWEEGRSLTLKGEAFFKVQKGKTFTVQTNIGSVTVLGTQFNVKKRTNYFEVKTYEGLVSVAYKDTLVKLPKGTIFRVINDEIATKKTFDIREKSWLQKESNFKSTSLRFVLAEIENQFGYTIETENINLNVLYSGGFKHTDVQIAMQSVTIPLQLSYKINGKKITVFNTAP